MTPALFRSALETPVGTLHLAVNAEGELVEILLPNRRRHGAGDRPIGRRRTRNASRARPASGVLSRATPHVRLGAETGGLPVRTASLGKTLGRTLRCDDSRTGRSLTAWPPKRRTRSRSREWLESDSDRHPLPPRHRIRRQSDRIWWRTAAQARAPRTRRRNRAARTASFRPL